MTTVNHECYASLEVAKLLKEAGFDWMCEIWIQWHPPVIEDGDHPGLIERGIDPKYTMPINETYPRPTLAVTQRWLREVKGIEVNTLCVYINNVKKYSYSVFEGKYNNERIEEGFDTYEEAQEASIKKALNIILEK